MKRENGGRKGRKRETDIHADKQTDRQTDKQR